MIRILRSRSILATGSTGNIPVKPSVRCAFAFEPLGFSISQLYPSTIEEPLQIGPDLYGFNPSFSRICVRSPALEVLCYRPCVYKHNSVLAPEFLQLGPCKPSFPAVKPYTLFTSYLLRFSSVFSVLYIHLFVSTSRSV
jgi:hypothetical protein